MASYGAYNSYYSEAKINDFSRKFSSFANGQHYTTGNNYQDKTQGVPESYSQGQGQYMIRCLSNGSNTSQNSLSTFGSPPTPVTFPTMSDWHSHYPPSDQVQYTPELAYDPEQPWWQEESSYSTDYMEPSISYTMSPTDGVDNMGYPYPSTMSIPRTSPMVTMQAPALMQEVELPNTSHMCSEPGCESKTSFKRKADLQRHWEQIHQTPDQKRQFFCDYPKCERSHDSFGRIDHFRQHYRDFHNEDLPRKSGESIDWYADKKQSVSPRTWRCVKCLSKVVIKDSGFTCNQCNTPCEKQRRNIRGYQ
ncbi:hypothetical protein PFICI_13101 [Pestalotiopsis fici W106-1]|uniref:C2H2-type domain-containing protein n=1 Tax=Pestalotiopsis fici (strain W106-1 / CGMCC3.15140) TaxID=1229662 RepID=W3WN73_PESFW|nr:uncharacterized protein PFICI_13101 [Pestalotiopsis fici W106-1]ETS74617.1 hypothetical protein PFICI_13101 [Pestalotiopsis fici W106-1]